MNKTYSEQFLGYCRTLTDSQVLNVIEKEREGKACDPDREADYNAAILEAQRRGLDID